MIPRLAPFPFDPFLWSLAVSGSFDGRPVSTEIAVGDIPRSSTDAASLVYLSLTGKALARRRRPWSLWSASQSEGETATVFDLGPDGRLEIVIRRRPAKSEEAFAADCIPFAEYLGLGLVVAEGASPLVTFRSADGTLYGRRYGDAEATYFALRSFEKDARDGRLAERLAVETGTFGDWRFLENPTALTFDDEIGIEAIEIVSEESRFRRGPFDVVVWRNHGDARLAWSTAPATVDALAACDPLRSFVVANRAVYHVDQSGRVTVAVRPVAGLPLYVDQSAALASPIFLDPSSVDELAFEPRTLRGKAWRAIRDGDMIDRPGDPAETIRRYLAARSPGLSGNVPPARLALAEARETRGVGAMPYPRRPLVSPYGPPYGDGGALRWIENPAANGFRPTDLADTTHRGWFTSEFGDEVARGVAFRLPGNRLVAGFVVVDSEAKVGFGTSPEAACVSLERLFDFGEPSDVFAAARLADRLAEKYAEDERETRRIEQAASEANELAELIEHARGEIRETFRHLATMWRRVGNPPLMTSYRDLCRSHCQGLADGISLNRKRLARLESEHGDSDLFRAMRD